LKFGKIWSVTPQAKKDSQLFWLKWVNMLRKSLRRIAQTE
jgi:hypothetical protein